MIFGHGKGGNEHQQAASDSCDGVQGRFDEICDLGTKSGDGRWQIVMGAGTAISPAWTRSALQIRVFGSKGALAWHQENPDCLFIRPQHAPHYVLRRGESWTGEAAQAGTRLKAGQVEGELEAFANLDGDAAQLIRARRSGRAASPAAQLCPTLADGVAGMRFIDGCVRSQALQGAWVKL